MTICSVSIDQSTTRVSLANCYSTFPDHLAHFNKRLYTPKILKIITNSLIILSFFPLHPLLCRARWRWMLMLLVFLCTVCNTLYQSLCIGLFGDGCHIPTFCLHCFCCSFANRNKLSQRKDFY